MISAVAEMYEIHPQTLRLYEREGLLKPSRTEGNTRLYTDEDLERLEFILNLARDLGVNIAGIAHHSADARAHGRDEPPDAELCGVRALGDADALPAGRARLAGAIVPLRKPTVVLKPAQIRAKRACIASAAFVPDKVRNSIEMTALVDPSFQLPAGILSTGMLYVLLGLGGFRA